MNNSNPKLKACVDYFEGLIAAREEVADRIELCASLNKGGLTPFAGLMYSDPQPSS